jgi:signal transduction histidine kinase/chemotaxis methyl-accepting protein methylase/ActR/RegA family two-component response regulator
MNPATEPHETAGLPLDGISASAAAERAQADSFAQLREACSVLRCIAPTSRARVWVPGCGTGEDLYALGMWMAEQSAGGNGNEPARYQLFGTDSSQEAIDAARSARFPLESLVGLAAEVQQRFFVKQQGHARVVDEVRFHAVFARHEALRDPPFVHIGLLMCQRLLRTHPEIDHDQLFANFHFALRAGGWLLVGPEHVSTVPADLFQVVDAEAGLFRTHATSTRAASGEGGAIPRRAHWFERSELNALNEELRGLGKQRQLELEALDRAHMDLNNFVDATQTLSLICDAQLQVTRVSSALAAKFGPKSLVTGASLAEAAAQLPGGARLLAAAQAVVEPDHEPNSEFTAGYAARSYLVRVSPYRTRRHETAGVVCVFTDVTALEEVHAQLVKREHQQTLVAELGVAALSGDGDATSTDILQLYRQALRGLRSVVDCECTGLFEAGYEPGVLLLRAAEGLASERKRTLIAPDSELALALTAKTPRPLHHLPEESREPRSGVSTQATLGVGCSLRFGEDVVGVLTLYRVAYDGSFSSDELNCIQAVANVLGGAIARQRWSRRLSLERGVVLAAAQAHDLAELGERAHAAIARVMPCVALEIWSRAAEAVAMPECAFSSASTSQPPAAATRPPDLASPWARAQPLQRTELEHDDSGTQLFLPIVAADQPLGALCLRVDSDAVLDRELIAGLERAASAIGEFVLRKRNEAALRESDQQKDHFLAMLGHELRNPLSAIRNATELLGLGQLDPPALARVHGVLDRQSHQMAKLIDGLLDVSRIVRGMIALEKSTFDLAPVLRELVQDRDSAQAKGTATIELHVTSEPLWVEGDRVRLLQVLENLLVNAVKFTPRTGRIQIHAQTEQDRVVVRFADTGAGIEPAFLPLIFEPFRQARQSVDRAKGGLGLGLALVRGIVELHGGRVLAESEGPGRGSTFTVELPLAAAAERPSRRPPVALNKLRVLVVEDNDDLAETLAALLRSIGHEVLAIADTGYDGLQAARELRPDVVLCDIGLPGELDGMDVARAVRKDPTLVGTRMVAVTGYGGPDDRARIYEAGFAACLIKPVELEMLQECLAQADRQPT